MLTIKYEMNDGTRLEDGTSARPLRTDIFCAEKIEVTRDGEVTVRINDDKSLIANTPGNIIKAYNPSGVEIFYYYFSGLDAAR